MSKSKQGCCGAKQNPSFSSLAPEYETYKLTGTYYMLNDGLTTTLMLNNKGSQSIIALPTIYSLAGTRLNLAPITVPAASYIDVDMYQLLAGQPQEFREGSMKISYEGGKQQLGAQVKMVDEAHNLIWAEQFVYTTKFTSSRLENVWWLPFENSKARVVVSNTSSGTVTASITVDGTSPQQTTPLQITLAPWQTRVLEIMRDLVGNENGEVQEKGGISITHTGNPGAVVARMFIARPNKGYSAASNFIDPDSNASQKWHGNGLRFRNLNSAQLSPVIAVRNTGTQTSHVSGKIIYTQPNGDVGTINLPQKTIGAGVTKAFELENFIDDLPASVTYGGIELEYDTPKGTIITSLQSVSHNGDHVFQVPMFDPVNIPSSAGGFPWKADGDFRTLVYLKNETDSPKKYTAHLAYAGGGYSLGIETLKAGQTVEIDFRKLRDEQTPGDRGELIPINIDSGQIAWSAHGVEATPISGRSEQISLAHGVASTYACANHCPNVIDDVSIDPEGFNMEVGDTASLTGLQTELNSYGQSFGPYTSESVTWESFDTGIATTDFGGDIDAVGVGQTNLQGTWTRTIWIDWGGTYCEPFSDELFAEAPVQVDPTVVINGPATAVDGATANFSATITGATATGIYWSFTSPSGAGNNPQLTFFPQNELATSTTAHWFASPNGPCTASLNSVYEVRVTISYSGGDVTVARNFTVTVPQTIGYVPPPEIVGNPTTAFNGGSSQWYVASVGNLSRQNPSMSLFVPATSQFYPKAFQHELKHENQYISGTASSYYLASSFYSSIQSLTAPSQALLNTSISLQYTIWKLQQRQALVSNLGTQMEDEAYAISDPINPQYVYQSTCGGWEVP